VEPFLRDFWHIAALSGEVKRELLARTIMDEPVLMYRQLDGTIVALHDRCIHRRVSLSAGRLIDDRVQCGYHGLEFDGSGKCVHIPGQTQIPPQARVKTYPTVERDGVVWIWMGDATTAETTQVPDYFSVCSSP